MKTSRRAFLPSMALLSRLFLVPAVGATDDPPEAPAPVDESTVSTAEGGLAENQAGPSDHEADLSEKEAGLSEEIVVTANRTAQERKDVPANITVLDETDIAGTAALAVDRVLYRVPGISMLRQQNSLVSSPSTQFTNVRNLGGGSARTLVLLEGVPLNDPAGGQVYWSRVPKMNIDRVEVIRGAGSNVWGNRAMAGVISLFTREPTERTVNFSALFGERNTSDVTLFGAEAREAFSLSIAANGFDSDGYQIFRPDQLGAVDEPSTKEYQSYVLKLEVPLSERARSFLRATYFDEDQDGGTPIRETKTDIQEGVAGIDLVSEGLDEWGFRAFAIDTGARDWNSLVARNRNSETLSEFTHQPSSSLGLSAVWSRGAGKQHRLMSGTDWQWIETEYNEQIFVPGEPTVDREIAGKQQLGGVFFQDLMELTPRWRVTAGGRFDRIRNYGGATRSTEDGSLVEDVEYEDDTSTTFNPSVGVVFHPSSTVSWQAAAYRGFRAPTASDLYRFTQQRGGIVIAPNPALDPETLVGVESGFRLARKAWGGQLNLFRNEIRDRSTILDVQEQGPSGGAIEPCGFIEPNGICRVRINVGEMTAKGAELDLDYRLRPAWRFSVSYLYEDAEFSEAPDNPELLGLIPRQMPENSYTARVEYSNHRLFSAGVQGRYVGDRFEDDANLLPIGSLFVIDVTASKDLTDRVSIFANVENALDEAYEVRVTSTLIEIGSPRWVYGGVRLRF